MNDTNLLETMTNSKEFVVSWSIPVALFIALWIAAVFSPDPAGTIM